MSDSRPFFSVVTVALNDAWALSKTAQSVRAQSFDDYEYIVVDGASRDGTVSLLEFWVENGLVSRWRSEADRGVYAAMNKAVGLAQGQYVVFMNAGDRFADAQTLSRAKALIDRTGAEALLGWGTLGDQIWASWCASPAFALASLGFCHQALYVSREVLERHPFDDRDFKTDSDTLQLARMIESGVDCRIVPEILARRADNPGLSADLERTRVSIVETIKTVYASHGVDESVAEAVLAFRRRAECIPEITQQLQDRSDPFGRHLALMVLDTLLLPASDSLTPHEAQELSELAISALDSGAPEASGNVEDFFRCQQIKLDLIRQARRLESARKDARHRFGEEEQARRDRGDSSARPPGRSEAIIVLTSFPGRIDSVRFTIESLLDGSVLPARIVLTLGRDEIRGPSFLPQRLRSLQRHGLEIKFVKRTRHQYDKFVDLDDCHLSEPIVLVDDDVIYRNDCLEILLQKSREFPDAVVCNRAHRINLDADELPAPYSEWDLEVHSQEPSFRIFPTGAGGVLYPPGFFRAPEVRDPALILRNAPYADDIWLKICSMNRGIPAVTTRPSDQGRWYRRYTPDMKSEALHRVNVGEKLNDLQMQASIRWLAGRLEERNTSVADLLTGNSIR